MNLAFSLLKNYSFRSNKMNYAVDTNNEIIRDLKFISRINKGEKINVRHRFIQQNDVITSISRTFYYKDNRVNTLTFIRNTINGAFNIIRTYTSDNSNEHENILAKTTIEDLKAVVYGITNLKDTYIDDVAFCCDIDTIIQDLNARIIEFEKMTIKEVKLLS